jgi:hypothetical protein
MLLALNIPYMFFMGKDSLLMMIEEQSRSTISSILQEKIIEHQRDLSDSITEESDYSSSQLQSQMTSLQELPGKFSKMPTFTYSLVSLCLLLAITFCALIIKRIGPVF